MRRHPAPLDDDTVDRLLRRRLDPADAPPGYATTARLLKDAAGVQVVEDVDPELLGSLVHAIASSPPTPTEAKMPSKLLTAKIATLAAGAVLATAGAAAAATGNLPGPAQDAVSHAVSHVGINLPDNSGSDHPTGNTTNSTDADQHGVDVSTAAHNTETTGKNHGADVSAVAKGDHGKPDTTGKPDDAGQPADAGSQAPVTTPNPGGTGTADTASGGHSTAGTSKASSHAAEGSSNADDNPGSSHH